MSITKVANFMEIYSRRTQTVVKGEKSLPSSEITYHDGKGYHVYVQLSLYDKLSNPQDKNTAEHLFEVIQRYVDLTSCCLQKTQGKILEVQGERLHIFFPAELTCDSATQVIAFCAALTNAVYDQKFKLGNTNFAGFKICLSYGRAVILATGTDADDSLISLGPCANEPAKFLQNVKAEFTAMQPSIAELIFDDVDKRQTWYQINLRDRRKLPTRTESCFNTILQTLNSFDPVYVSGRFSVNQNATFIPGRNVLRNAVYVKGMFMRADLDGFTSRVEDAFATGHIDKLVADFSHVLTYGNEFINNASRPIVRIPWAGDCANLVILPKDNESIEDAKFYYPATGAHDWLSCYDGIIAAPYNDAAWLVSICSGNTSTGNSQILIASINTDDHNFLFASGWGVGRSLDAHEQDYLRANEAVISKEDYNDLDESYKKYFKILNSEFACSLSIKETKEFTQTVVPTLTAKDHRVCTTIANSIPIPRPHWRKTFEY